MQSSSPVLCTAKYRGGVQRTERLKKQQQQQNQISTSPLPCPAALRGATKQYREEVAFQSSSPVFCNAKYRGGVRRTEGLKNSDSNKIKYQTPPLPCPAALRGVVYKIEAEAKGKYISPSSSVFCAAKYRGGVRRTEGLENTGSREVTELSLLSPMFCHTIYRCGVPEGQGGKHYNHNS